MHSDSLDSWRHDHVFLGEHHARNERRSWAVVILCTAMMAAEIVGGLLWGSMALVADGLHMSTHAGALVIAAFAYAYARRHAHDERFTFGTGKLGDLAAFTSAIVLAMIALLIGYESVVRLSHPVAIAFDQAIPLAAVGLAVNLLSAWLLHEDDGDVVDAVHKHDGSHHQHHSEDHNLRAAYIHVVADAAVSVLALIGLTAGRALGWEDPVMGIVGMLVIANWSWNLVCISRAVLLDMRPEDGVAAEIAHRLEAETDDRISDLHLWRVGPGHNAAVVSLVSDRPAPPATYKDRLASIAGLSHVTIARSRPARENIRGERWAFGPANRASPSFREPHDTLAGNAARRSPDEVQRTRGNRVAAGGVAEDCRGRGLNQIGARGCGAHELH